jgi:hypothetical protein
MSGDRVTSAGPVTDTNVPEKKPYAIENTTIAPTEEIDVQLNATIEQHRTNGAIMLRGPIKSAKKLGTIRPNTEDAFNMVRR